MPNAAFWGDYDQRHPSNASAQYRWSPRSSISALFRYGSNYPLIGYYENLDGVMYVGSSRNDIRLPYYARLDVRADRSYDFTDYRLTLFAQVLNVLGRVNYRRQFNGLSTGLQYRSTYESLLGLTPTVGVLIEF